MFKKKIVVFAYNKTTNIGSKKIYYPEVYVFVYKNGKVFYEQERLLAGDDKDGLALCESHTIGC